MWFIVVEVEQETSAPPPKKNPGSAPALSVTVSSKGENFSCPFLRMMTKPGKLKVKTPTSENRRKFNELKASKNRGEWKCFI